MRADLHIHTNHSDGVYSLEEVVERAKLNKMSIIAITDHDNVGCYDDYCRLKEQLNYPVIIGIELSTNYCDTAVHILGYFKDNIIGDELLSYVRNIPKKREKRAQEIIEKLKKYYDID